MESNRSFMRRLAESIRRHTKVRTHFGTVGIPTGTHSALVFHMNVKQTGYVLLNAQTNLIEGKIDYEQIQSISQAIIGLFRRGRLYREALVWYIGTASYLIILLTFILFLILIVLLTQREGTFFGQSLLIYISIVALVVGLLLFRYPPLSNP